MVTNALTQRQSESLTSQKLPTGNREEQLNGIKALHSVRNNQVLISPGHINSGPAFDQFKQDLIAIAGKLEGLGIDIGNPETDVFASLKKLQEKALISEDGEVYVRRSDGLYKVDGRTGEITEEKYTGDFTGLFADGIAGPRSMYVIDALLGRRDGEMLEFERFKQVTSNTWDKSQVREGPSRQAGDGGQLKNPNVVGPIISGSEVQKKILAAMDTAAVNQFRVVRDGASVTNTGECFNYAWEIAGQVFKVGIGEAHGYGEASGEPYMDQEMLPKNQQELENLKSLGLEVGDIVKISLHPREDPSSLQVEKHLPHWFMMVAKDKNGHPIFSDNWDRYWNIDDFIANYQPRLIDEVFRLSKMTA
jgi:hypothetical protein